MDILKTHEGLVNKSIDSNDLVKESLDKANKLNKDLNAFVTIIDKPINDGVSNSLLSGIPCAVKDNLSMKDVLSTASSNTLKDYVPFFDATAVKKLKENNAVIIGKTVMDELGMGGTGTTGHTGVVHNPYNLEHMTGGSSAGSAAAVSAGIVPYALGSDTGDSIRKPAAYCGIVGYKPTYGMVSRYGLFPFASSLDHVGVLASSVKNAAIVIDAIKGLDPNDMTTWDSSKINLLDSLDKTLKDKKVFYIKEICDINQYENPSKELKEVIDNFNKTINCMEKIGIKVNEVSIDKTILNAIFPTYICISCAEASSNYSNLTGIVFGPRGEGDNVVEMMKNHRTLGFSPLIKRRFVIGSYVLQKENQEKYFINAKRVRRLIVDIYKDLFKTYDACILPCASGPAPKIKGSDNKISTEETILENHMAIGNFGGFPSITIPSGLVNDLPIGINITGNTYDDENVLSLAYHIEKTISDENMFKGGNK